MESQDKRLGSATETPSRRSRTAANAESTGTFLDGRDSDDSHGPNTERHPAEASIGVSDEEALRIFDDSLENSVLPDLPRMPGYHVCWVSTSNPRDSVAMRRRLGYEPITLEMMPDNWDGVSVKTGDYGGVVGINEMVAMRIPSRRYQLLMTRAHHDRPLAEEENLRARVEQTREGLQRAGSRVFEEGDGTAELVQRAPSPEFSA